MLPLMVIFSYPFHKNRARPDDKYLFFVDFFPWQPKNYFLETVIGILVPIVPLIKLKESISLLFF